MKRVLQIGLFVITTGTMLGMGSFLLYRHFNPPARILSYDDCAKRKGSIVQERYPAVCVTREGLRFVQPVIFVTTTPRLSPDLGKATLTEPLGYTCPQTAWVDCMPGPMEAIRHECAEEYLSWAKTNCPSFQGAVY